MEWINNEGVIIEFDDIPRLRIRYALPNDTKQEKEDIKKYPFINCKDLNTTIKYKGKAYNFVIPAHYKWNGATIPKFFWRIIGSSTQPEFLVASCIHDMLCENHYLVGNDRNLSSLVFKELLIQAGVGRIKSQIMYLVVDNFQRFCGW